MLIPNTYTMKKKYFITFIACLFTIGITAQPTITYNGNAPQIGDTYNLSGAMGTFNPGPAGGNQSWDFSDVQSTISAGVTAVYPSSTPFADDFPDATIAFRDNDTSYESYNYWQLTTSELYILGMGTDPGSNQNIIHYLDTRKNMQYPFAYNDSYTDTYFYSAPSVVMLIHRRGSITAIADAWGSVKTPADTYNNTLRIKKVKVYTDSVWNNEGDLMSVATHTVTDYEWYTATSHYPVLHIQVTEAGSSISYSSLVGGIEDNSLLSQISIYPNPADDIINVRLSDVISDKIEINLVNQMGQQLTQLTETGNHRFSADISRLAPGVYFIRIKSCSGNYAVSKFIKQ
jgi:hypothetical protein